MNWYSFPIGKSLSHKRLSDIDFSRDNLYIILIHCVQETTGHLERLVAQATSQLDIVNFNRFCWSDRLISTSLCLALTA
jgi:hypothetical protein